MFRPTLAVKREKKEKTVEGHDRTTQQTEQQPSTGSRRGASISARNERVSTYHNANNTRTGELSDACTQQETSHNSNQFIVNHT